MQPALVVGQVLFAGLCAQEPASRPAASSPARYRVIEAFAVGGQGGWDYLTIDSATQRLYVPRSDRVVVLDARTGSELGVVPGTDGVHGVALVPALGRGFTSDGRANAVTVFDLATLKVVKRVAVGSYPDAILFEPVTRRVFVFNGRSKDASVLDPDALTVVATVPLGGKPEFAVGDGKGTLYVNVEDTSEVLRIAAESGKVTARWKLAPGEEPSGLAFDVENGVLYSVCANERMIALDVKTGSVLASPAIGKGVDGVAFDAARGFALSSDGESGTITVVATTGAAKHAVVQTLPTVKGARTIVHDPATGRCYLPTADLETPPVEPGAPRRRPVAKPGSFRILVVGR